MTGYIARKLIQLPFVLLIISILVFSLMHVAPGDPSLLLVSTYASPEAVEALRAQYSLDKPLVEQYLIWLGRIVQGDLGRSLFTRQPVATMFFDRLGINVLLTSLATGVSLMIAIPVGIASAYRHNRLFDQLSMFLSVAAFSVPNFALGLIMILIFSLWLGILPVTGAGLVGLWESPTRAIPPLIMPVLAIAAWQTAVYARLLRASMLEVLGKEYIRVARAKGLREHAVLGIHALRNALIPLVTIVGINFVFLLGSTVTIEKVFAIPGIGTILIRAVESRDFPVIQGITLFTALFFVSANVLTDIFYAYLDPRIRYE